MAEYINRNALVKHCRMLAEILKDETDVPASWGDVYNDLAKHLWDLPAMDKNAVFEKERVELARDIFAEIEYLFFNHFMLGEISLFEDKYAELKKKHTEGNEE